MKTDIESLEQEVAKECNSKEHDNNDEEGPRKGVGCVNGCARDSHYVLAFLTIALLTLPLLWLYDIIWTEFFMIVECILFVGYLVYCFTSHSFQYLRNVVTTEDIKMFMGRMYEQKPEIQWSIRCYHWETKTRTVTTHVNGRVETKTETYREKVYTHSARGVLEFASWKDVSKPLPASEIENYTMTKVSVKKRWIGDAGASAQKKNFINRNNRDKHYEFTETLYLTGYNARFLGFLNIEDIPCLAHVSWYVLSHVTVVFALPYRMWLSSRTGKVRTEIVKQIFTSSKSRP